MHRPCLGFVVRSFVSDLIFHPSTCVLFLRKHGSHPLLCIAAVDFCLQAFSAICALIPSYLPLPVRVTGSEIVGFIHFSALNRTKKII